MSDMDVRKDDLTGRRFGRIVVLGRVGSSPGRISIWRCRCDCGTEFNAYASNLKSGRTRSCGCLKADMNRKRIRIKEEK